jgi:hypothetical protein
MRKTLIRRIALAAVVAVAILLAISPGDDRRTRRKHLPPELQDVLSKLDEMQIGMTRAEVDALFSGWNKSEGPMNPPSGTPYLRVTYAHGMYEGDYFIEADFDSDGRLTQERWNQWVK